jgi:formylglycine-generating enzyme required for sulfatase activity
VVVLTPRLLALALLASVSCGPKPLRVVDDAPDASLDARGDVVSPDVVTPNCADDPSRPECARVRVAPAATFCVGVPASAATSTWNASPALCDLSLTPFEVDAHEVTVGRFRAFHARWIAGQLPAWREARFANGVTMRVPLAPRTALSEWSPAVVGCNWSDAPGGAREQHPINCVGWTLAMYFCASEGGHLLTATEYEYLARWHGAAAGEDRPYPWGSAPPSCDRAHYGPCPGDDGLETRRVGSLAATAGVYDLAGNVAELVADTFASYATLAASPCWGRVDPLCQPTLVGAHYARGSSHQNDSELVLRGPFRPMGSSGDASPARGFRCVYPAR